MSQERFALCMEMIIVPWENNDNANTPDNFGNGESYGGATHGTESNGNPATFAFDGSGGTYVSSGRIESLNDFWGYRADGVKGNDHFRDDDFSDFGNTHDGDHGCYT